MPCLSLRHVLALIPVVVVSPIIGPVTAASAEMPRAKGYNLSVPWQSDVAGSFKVRATVTKDGKPYREQVRWTAMTYQVVGGKTMYRRVIDTATSRTGSATLRTQPPYTGEVGGYYVVRAQVAGGVIQAKALYACDSPGSCTLRKVYPVKFRRG
jgi:hypothetical protein